MRGGRWRRPGARAHRGGRGRRGGEGARTRASHAGRRGLRSDAAGGRRDARDDRGRQRLGRRHRRQRRGAGRPARRPRRAAAKRRPDPGHAQLPDWAVRPGQSTTLVCVCTDAALDKRGCGIVARIASAGIARAVDPAFTPLDGDIVFCLASGPWPPAAPGPATSWSLTISARSPRPSPLPQFETRCAKPARALPHHPQRADGSFRRHAVPAHVAAPASPDRGRLHRGVRTPQATNTAPSGQSASRPLRPRCRR